MKNTADVTGGKPIAVLLQFISGVSAVNPLVAFYDIHGVCFILCYYDNIYNIVDKYFSISIAPVRRRGESLVHL
jgi:hypothetical protein